MYPTCTRCGKGRMIPMLMSGPACDLACEREPAAVRVASSKGWLGASAAAEAQCPPVWKHGYGITQPAPVAPVAPSQQIEVSCHTLSGKPVLYSRDRSRGMDLDKVVKLGSDYNLKFDDGSQQIVYVSWVNRIVIILQTSTMLMSQWTSGEPAILEVP